MPDTDASILGRTVATLTSGDLLGVRVALRTDVPNGNPVVVPQFEDMVWNWDMPASGSPSIPAPLIDALKCDPNKSVFVDTIIPDDANNRKRLSLRTDRGTYRNSAVLVHECLTCFPPSTSVVFLVLKSLLIGEEFRVLRSVIDEEHGVTWVVYTDGGLIPGCHIGLQLALFVVEVQRPDPSVRRLVDLRGVEPTQWVRQLRLARKRYGGEVGRSVVLRQTRLGDQPWTFERFTAAYSESRMDSATIGTFVPLGDLVDLSFGIQLAERRNEIITHSDDDSQPPDYIPVLSAREVTPDGLVPSSRHWVKPSDVADDSLVQAGDLLLRKFVADGSRGPRLCVAVVPPGLQAAFSSNILRIRWKPSVPQHAQQLLVSWLTSNRASEALAARGVQLQLLSSVLSELEVPYPHESLLTALGELAKLEGWYTERKDAVRIARQEIFESNEYAVSVLALMLARQSERERVAAADDSQGFGYKVRNYYPHPIALRREQLLVKPHGGDRLKATLECAEHLVHFVALCGILQLKHVYPNQEIPSKHLRAKLAMGRLTFDWGTSWSIIQEAVASTSKHVDSLVLPFPQLKLIEDVNNSDDVDLTQAESRLREWRNKESHLARLPDAELSKMSAEFMQHLDCLLSAMRFLADVPLVLVRDCWLDGEGLTQERYIEFEWLRGHSTAFERRTQPYDEELPRGHLGLIGFRGRCGILTPWLRHHECPLCRRPEVFMFNRFEKGTLNYVAMETGHPWESPEGAAYFAKLTECATNTKR